MNYVITGSLGHISKPIVKSLLSSGHSVKVITSNQDRVAETEALGATASVGSVEDELFLTDAFDGADAVYLMIPPKWQVDNWFGYQQTVANAYSKAVKTNNIKYIVQLSSIGAHMRKGAGPIDGVGYLEEKLGELSDANVLMLRPSYFMYNLNNMIGLVKHANIFGGNFGGTEPLALVHTDDIAEVASKALLNLDFTGHSIQYIVSDERSTDEIAKVLGASIGKPEIPWVVLSDEQQLEGMLGAGIQQEIADGYVQMGKSIREGLIQADYFKNKPTFQKTKLEDFAVSFKYAYEA